jgi:hypothetical protein
MSFEWKIWYLDGSTFSNFDGAPEDAPGDAELRFVELKEN